MAEHLTRRELRTDQFAVSAEHAAQYLGMHRKQAIQAGGLIILAVVLIAGGYFWMAHAAAVRSEKLSEALQIADRPVGTATPQPGASNFPTQQAKDAAEKKAFTDLARNYSGSREGAVAEYSLAGMEAGTGNDGEARKHFQSAADSGNKQYASLAKLALAQLDFGENRQADGRKLLQELIDHPTEVVSKSQATMTLARMIGPLHPLEARALLAPLLKEPGQVGQMANMAQSDIPAK